jgi:hypothetical protein
VKILKEFRRLLKNKSGPQASVNEEQKKRHKTSLKLVLTVTMLSTLSVMFHFILTATLFFISIAEVFLAASEAFFKHERNNNLYTISSAIRKFSFSYAHELYSTRPLLQAIISSNIGVFFHVALTETYREAFLDMLASLKKRCFICVKCAKKILHKPKINQVGPIQKRS